MPLTSWLENFSSPALMRAGQALLAQQAVSVLACDTEQCQARVQDGQHSYLVTLAEQSTCECGTDNQGGCAHMAATALAWLQHSAAGLTTQRKASKTAAPQASAGPLRARLEQHSSAELAQLLDTLCQRSREVSQQVTLWLERRGQAPAALKATLSQMLGRAHFRDYQATKRYVASLEPMLDALRELLAEGQAASAAELADWAQQRLIKVLENVDDSGGYLGELMGELSTLLATACEQGGMPTPALVKLLAKRCLEDEWGLYTPERFAAALGPQGLQALAEVVHQAWAKQPSYPPGSPGSSFFSGSLLDSVMVELAQLIGNPDWEIAALSRDSRCGYQCLLAAQAMHAAGRVRAAITWLEQGIRHYPDDTRQHVCLARWYWDDGLEQEAQGLLWTHFEQRPTLESFQLLRQYSGANWPHWRAQCEARLSAQQAYGHRVLIECLLDDDGLDATLPRVRAEWLNASFLEELATRCMADHPAQAIRWLGDLLAQAQKTASNQAYHDVVRLLRKLQALLPEAEFAQQLADLRQTYHRRRNLMLLLNQAF